MKLLIVEDGPLRKELCEAIGEIACKPRSKWARDNFVVESAGCAADAKAQLLDAAKIEQPYDLMLLDLGLPQGTGGNESIENGFAVLQVAQKSAVRTIVILSGMTSAINRARRLGVTNFVSKEDFSIADAVNAVAGALDSLPPRAGLYSCFISYSDKDHTFATQLNSDLRSRGVTCWFAPDDMKIGEWIRERIDEAIYAYDKLLLVLSKDSISSSWVRQEVKTALEREYQQDRSILFPIRLDDTVLKNDETWIATIRSRHIGDFHDWNTSTSYNKAFDRLLRDLRQS